MNISDRIRVSDLRLKLNKAREKLPPEILEILSELILRIDLYIQDNTIQIRSNTSLYGKRPDQVEGAKQGDVFVYKNPQGDVEVAVKD